jgi:hypothetical protein
MYHLCIVSLRHAVESWKVFPAYNKGTKIWRMKVRWLKKERWDVILHEGSEGEKGRLGRKSLRLQFSSVGVVVKQMENFWPMWFFQGRVPFLRSEPALQDLPYIIIGWEQPWKTASEGMWLYICLGSNWGLQKAVE